MRMRRKSNLDERIRRCSNSLLFIETEEFYKKTEEEKYHIFNFDEVYGNNNPLWIEIGCGKGQFAFELAKRNPSVNVLAIEKISNVILDGTERAEKEKPINLKFLNASAENLCYYIENEKVDRIFLNFSCPYPKYHYRNRRLTYYRFLDVYKKLLKKSGEIHLKTDNEGFFEFSIQSFSENGFLLKNISLDLHSSKFAEENIRTEYEEIFTSQGKRIYKLEAYLP